MIEPTEFRIGNTLKGGEVFSLQIMGVEFYSKRNTLYSSTHPKCKPVKLTPEILEQLGFEKKKNKFTKWKIDLIEDETDIYSFDLGRIYIDIKYLHQLQNLYFALTGEELTQSN